MINRNNYDLEERTSRFGEDVIKFCKTLKLDTVSRPIVSQIVRSATSIGANYMEANNASSRKDFQNKIFICKKESQETKHWFRMLLECYPEEREEITKLSQENQEFLMIFQKIISTMRNGKMKTDELNVN